MQLTLDNVCLKRLQVHPPTLAKQPQIWELRATYGMLCYNMLKPECIYEVFFQYVTTLTQWYLDVSTRIRISAY